ncbi:flagellin N-terminal helical domain-containing protein [Stappia indica]|uniref:flagellin N-terminal helical domain-containing protein n=1 Tax=Stappia indica TaxID=538381 RepID=UPI001CD54AEE|nr:flagellin [Stappia indica]MCA1298843.1 flagellin [Stappia indica]
MSDITLSAGVRQNLLTLQNTADMMATTQNRLATGKKVNSALDNPTNFFTAQALSARANDLDALLDGISNAIKTIEAADNGITAITKLVESAQSTARQALQDGGAGSGTVVESSSSISTNGLAPIAGESIQDQAKRQTFANLGFAAGDTIQVQTTDTNTGTVSNFDIIIGTTQKADGSGPVTTVADALDVINASGIVTAEVTDAGKLKLTGSDAQTVNLSITDTGGDASTATTQATSLAASLGFGSNTNVDLSSPADGDYVDAGETAVTFTDGATAGAADVLSITTQANPASNSSTRQKLVTQFNDILGQIDKLAGDASFNGINLIDSSSSKLTVAFNEKRDAATKSELKLTGEDLTSSGLNITRTTSLNDSEANAALDELANALITLREAGSKFGSSLSMVQIRKDYTKASINTLQTGADNLVLADTNEEGANLLALQTRQQLSTTALSMASQADQAVLRLF